MTDARAGEGLPLPAIEVAGLSKSYGSTRALDDVSFEVERGGVTALLGLNGAGKTTLFQILTGLFVADAGTVKVNGEEFKANPTLALARMGLVFQQQVLDPDLTVHHNLRFYSGLHGLRGAPASQAIGAALGRLGVAGLEPRQVRELSGGTRRKLEIARALITAPDLLLLDEPSTGLDTGSRKDLVTTIFDLAGDGKLAVLWATHLVHEVGGAAKVVVLHRGRVVADAPPAELIAETGTNSLEEAFLSIVRAEGGERDTA